MPNDVYNVYKQSPAQPHQERRKLRPYLPSFRNPGKLGLSPFACLCLGLPISLKKQNKTKNPHPSLSPSSDAPELARRKLAKRMLAPRTQNCLHVCCPLLLVLKKGGNKHIAGAPFFRLSLVHVRRPVCLVASVSLDSACPRPPPLDFPANREWAGISLGRKPDRCGGLMGRSTSWSRKETQMPSRRSSASRWEHREPTC